MSHTTVHKDKLIARVRRIKGQLEGIERALEAQAGCAEVLRQLASVRGAMNGLTVEVMEGHLQGHVLDASTGAERRAAVPVPVVAAAMPVARGSGVRRGGNGAGREHGGAGKRKNPSHHRSP